MAKEKRKTDERLEKRIKSYEDTLSGKRVETSSFRKPGSRKKIH